MPRVKIDYVVSFSSEDPENPASNLLAWEVNKKMWLCKKGEPSCSVVLQLAKAVKICTVHIGAYHSALVEVLVGRSETPNEPFQVLVPSSVFESPRAAATHRVRSFAAAELAAAAAQRWDRLRVVCSQPYDKHSQYGLSFVHVYSPEEATSTPVAPGAPTPEAPGAPLAADSGAFSSDEEEFHPGELFAKHVQKSKDEPNADTGAQIRQATSQALRNIPDSSIKLTKTPITKPSKRAHSQTDTSTDRQRDSLLYTDEDSQPHRKIDRVLSRHNDEKTPKHKEKTKNGSRKKDDKVREMHKKDDTLRDLHKRDDTVREMYKTDDTPRDLHKKEDTLKTLHKIDDTPRNLHKKDSKLQDGSHKKDDKHKDKHQTSKDVPSKRDRDEASSSTQDRRYKNKDNGSSGDERRKRSYSEEKRSSEPHLLLSDVVFVLSGYENPRRAHIRSTALALGARCQRDWGAPCTHLICAFPNTPKLRAVRSSSNGGAAVVVRAEWVEACARRRRRLPWQWFATEPARRVHPPPGWDNSDGESECDTDDEIERVRQKMKKQRTDRAASPPRNPSPGASPPRVPSFRVSPPRVPSSVGSPPRVSSAVASPPPADVSGNSDVVFVKDERIQDGVCVVESDGDTTEEDSPPPSPRARVHPPAGLPAPLAGRAAAARGEGAGLARYVRALGGVLVEEDSDADYIIYGSGAEAPKPSTEAPEPGAGPRGARVRAAWLWRCYREGRLCPVDDYLIA